jgi:tetratricopeptide (TPR) repeat protein
MMSTTIRSEKIHKEFIEMLPEINKTFTGLPKILETAISSAWIENDLGKQFLGMAEECESDGRINYNRGDFKQSLECYQKSLATIIILFGENKYPVEKMYKYIGKLYLVIGKLYGKFGDHKQSLEYLKKFLAIWIEKFGENHAKVAKSYLYIGCIYE